MRKTIMFLVKFLMYFGSACLIQWYSRPTIWTGEKIFTLVIMALAIAVMTKPWAWPDIQFDNDKGYKDRTRT